MSGPLSSLACQNSSYITRSLYTYSRTAVSLIHAMQDDPQQPKICCSRRKLEDIVWINIGSGGIFINLMYVACPWLVIVNRSAVVNFCCVRLVLFLSSCWSRRSWFRSSWSSSLVPSLNHPSQKSDRCHACVQMRIGLLLRNWPPPNPCVAIDHVLH